MNNEKILKIVYVLLALIVVGWSFYFVSFKKTNEVNIQPSPTPISIVDTKVEYKNEKYGFSVSLPDSWKGFSIVEDIWEGYAPNDTTGQDLIATGPLIFIRHPQWTEKNQRQDIPVMVFTTKEWDDVQADKFHIGAAPIGPSEIGRNSKYVFTLPARYNFAFPTGFEEVETILEGKPLTTFNVQ